MDEERAREVSNDEERYRPPPLGFMMLVKGCSPPLVDEEDDDVRLGSVGSRRAAISP